MPYWDYYNIPGLLYDASQTPGVYVPPRLMGDVSGTYTCPGEFSPRPIYGSGSASNVHDVGVAVADRPPGPYCAISYFPQWGASGGWNVGDCSASSSTPGSFTQFDVSMPTFGVLDLLDVSTGALVDPVGTGTGGHVVWVARPEPLTWLAQDPEDLANRIIWMPDEIEDITLAIAILGHSYDIVGNYSVYTYTPALLPSTVEAGDPLAGFYRL